MDKAEQQRQADIRKAYVESLRRDGVDAEARSRALAGDRYLAEHFVKPHEDRSILAHIRKVAPIASEKARAAARKQREKAETALVAHREKIAELLEQERALQHELNEADTAMARGRHAIRDLHIAVINNPFAVEAGEPELRKAGLTPKGITAEETRIELEDIRRQREEAHGKPDPLPMQDRPRLDERLEQAGAKRV